MKRIELPTSAQHPPEDLEWSKLGLSPEWLGFISQFTRHHKPTHIQKVCLADLKMLQGRRNLIVSAPTNSGKSLIGYLFLLAGLKQGKRALLLEPFRALAQEKFEELEERSETVSEFIGRKFVPIITTGDHPLDDDAMTSPPPKDGELVIATPERFDVILRNKEYDDWIASFGVVCVDEAHLISDPRRGGTLDLVVASLLSRKNPPRVLLLSATLGNTDVAQQWLDPCDLAESSVRWPPLRKEIACLDEGEDPNQVVVEHAKHVLEQPETALIAFTYQKASAAKLASVLHEQTGHVALHYHSNMPLHRKREVRDAFLEGRCRLLVTTTALGTGINLPATHLIIRDTTFYPDGKIQASQMLQMMGRAGRGEREGHAIALLKPKDEWEPGKLQSALVDEPLPELRSGLLARERSSNEMGQPVEAATRVALSILCRGGKEGMTDEELQSFCSSMLAGKSVGTVVDDAVSWLRQNLLAHLNDEDGRLVATALGAAGAAGCIPPKTIASLGSLFRDLFGVDADMRLLGQMSALDMLFLAELLSDRSFLSVRFSEDLANKIDQWALANRDKSVVFHKWVRGSSEASKAEELLGSLGIDAAGKASDRSRRFAYMRFFSAIVLWTRGNGTRWEDIARRWGLDNDQIAEDEWIRNRSWLLAGMAEVLEVRCFYFHLRGECQASDDKIKQAKRILQRMRAQCYQVLGRLKYCSPLGPLLTRMKTSGTKGVGRATIQKLEEAGLTSPESIRSLSPDQMKELKLDKKRVAAIQSYLRRI